MSPRNINSLPPELLIEITTYLALPAHLAFKISTRHLYLSLPSIRPTSKILLALSDCARYALYCCMQFDRARRCCGLCKQWYPNRLFKSIESRTIEYEELERRKVLRSGHGDLGGPGMVDLPDGLCAWEMPRFVQFRDMPGTRYTTWYTRTEKICMCCGQVVIISFDPRYSKALCTCRCDTCGTRDVRTFVRVGGICRGKWVIWRDEVGVHWAREWRTDGVVFEDLPVQEFAQFFARSGCSSSSFQSVDRETGKSNCVEMS
jgi:hypothetical protein